MITFNDDSPIFTDPTPVGRNSTGQGRTVGEERRNATIAAMNIIESQLRITQPIEVEFDTLDLNCSTFGVGTYNRSFVNGRNQIPDTIYPIALSNQLSRADLTPPGTADVLVFLNSNILFNQCDAVFDYSLVPRPPSERDTIDYIDLVLHEISHGLGFEVRPAGAQLPFIFEQLLFAGDENAVFGRLNDNARERAASKVKNVVFTGRLTNALAGSSLLPRNGVVVNRKGKNVNFDVNAVVGTPRIRGNGFRAQMVNLDLNTCEPEGNLSGKIVIMGSGCAREELGLNGTRFGGIQLAQRQGARAVIVSSGDRSFRFSSFVPVTIPVVSVLFSELQTLQSLAANGKRARLVVSGRKKGGTDNKRRPYVFTGPSVPSGVSILHYDPSVSVRPGTGRTARALQEPVVAQTNREPVSRSLGFNVPALIDLGWAASSCGNRKVEQYEQCDDGNMRSGDGCEQNCLLP